MSGGFTAPTDRDDWPFEKDAEVIANLNSSAEIRHALNVTLGLEEHTDRGALPINYFTKEKLAEMLVAAGVPDREELA